VKERPEELIFELDWTLNSREEFNELKRMFAERVMTTDVERAAKYFRLIRFSYGSKLSNFAGQPKSPISEKYPVIRAAHSRLDGVVIENKDFEALIKQYDREDALCYCDPPYFGTEDYYGGVSFSRADHVRLRNVLANIEGKFILSYNDCPEVRELYKEFCIEAISRPSNLSQRFESGAEFPELIISNYDTSERSKLCEQMQFEIWQ
jgi:DNA adenine methylase